MEKELKVKFDEILARNNPEELRAAYTLLQHFDGTKEAWMQKILPMEMAFDGDKGTLVIERNMFMDNTINILHGGILMLLSDTLMGSLCNKVAPDGKRVVTHEMNTYFTRKGTGNIIRAEAEIIKKGSMTYLVRSEVFSDDISIGYATGSFFLIDLPSE